MSHKCDHGHLAETQTTRSGPLDRHHNTATMQKSDTGTYRETLRQCAASSRRARDKEMSLLSGHHRIMEAAEAALVMMVLEEGWLLLGQLRSRQPSVKEFALAMI